MSTAPGSSGIGDTLRCPADTHGLGNSTGAAFGQESAPYNVTLNDSDSETTQPSRCPIGPTQGGEEKRTVIFQIAWSTRSHPDCKRLTPLPTASTMAACRRGTWSSTHFPLLPEQPGRIHSPRHLRLRRTWPPTPAFMHSLRRSLPLSFPGCTMPWARSWSSGQDFL